MAQSKSSSSVDDVQTEVLALASLYPSRDELVTKLEKASEEVATLESQLAEVDAKIAAKVSDIKGKIVK